MKVLPEAITGRKPWKNSQFLGKTRFEVKIKSPNPSQWTIIVLTMASLVQLAIQKLVGEQLLVMQSMDSS